MVQKAVGGVMKLIITILCLILLTCSDQATAGGPLVSKTYTEDFTSLQSGALTGWSNIGYSNTNLPSYDAAEDALKFDVYGVGKDEGWWNVSALQLHKSYPMTIECDMKVASGLDKFWNGIVLEPGQMNYSFWGADAQYGNNNSTTPYNQVYQNEFNSSFGALYGTTSIGVYHHYKIVYSGGTASYYVDGVLKGSHAWTLAGNAPLSLISVSPADRHSTVWFKNLTATGVFVMGLPSINFREYLAVNNGLMASPSLDDVTSSPIMGGLELAYSTGYHWYTATSTAGSGSPTQAYYGVVPDQKRQLGGTFALSGNALTKPYAPPILSAWDKLQWQATFASGTIKVQVCDAGGTPLSDSIIPGNSSQIDLNGKTSIDLSTVNAATYPQLSFRVYMTSSTTASSPILYELFTTFSTNTDTLAYTAPATTLTQSTATMRASFR